MKHIITVAILLIIITRATAQQSISWGLEAGFTLGGLTGRDVDSFSNGGPAGNLKGFTLGVVLNNTITRHVGLRHAVLFSGHTTAIQIDDGLHPVFKSHVKRRYIELFPASPTWQWNRLRVWGGPYIGLLLSASIQRKDDDGNLYTDKSFYGDAVTMSHYSQKFDAGIELGLSYTLPKGIYLSGRLVRGFVPLIEDAAKQPQWRIYNYSGVLAIGYQFAH